MDRPPEPASTLYDQVGGMPFFDQLVATFYEGVSADEILRPLYPEADLAGARRRLALFLAQYWGGPPTYNLERGHPRLRARHFPFWIGPAARERWLLHMRRAVEVSEAPPDAKARLSGYFAGAAVALQNQDDDISKPQVTTAPATPGAVDADGG